MPFAATRVGDTAPVTNGAKWASGAIVLGLTFALVTGCGQSDEVYQVDMINDTGQPISLPATDPVPVYPVDLAGAVRRRRV